MPASASVPQPCSPEGARAARRTSVSGQRSVRLPKAATGTEASRILQCGNDETTQNEVGNVSGRKPGCRFDGKGIAAGHNYTWTGTGARAHIVYCLPYQTGDCIAATTGDRGPGIGGKTVVSLVATVAAEIFEIARVTQQRRTHHVEPGRDTAAQVIAVAVDTVDRQRRSRIDYAQVRAKHRECRHNRHPAVDPKLGGVRVGVGDAAEMPGRHNEFGFRCPGFSADLYQRPGESIAGDIGDDHAAKAVPGSRQRRLDQRAHDTLLMRINGADVGDAGFAMDGTFDPGITGVDQQHHQPNLKLTSPP